MNHQYIQKFLKIKEISINKYLNNISDDFSLLNLQEFIFNLKNKNKNKLIKYNIVKNKKYNNYEYSIIKEINTNSWFLLLPEIFIITITHQDYQSIKDLLNKSIYKFKIYKTITNYTLICVSHTFSEIKEYTKLLYDNKCIMTYIVLLKLLGPFLLLNESYIDTSLSYNDDNDVLQSIKEFYNINIKYIETIGNGKIKDDLNEYIDIIIQIKKNYKYLPKHNFLL